MLVVSQARHPTTLLAETALVLLAILILQRMRMTLTLP
jgi:hypothetical protein